MGNAPSDANLTVACEVARNGLHVDLFEINGNCTAVNGTCPASCGALVEDILDACPGGYYSLPLGSGPNSLNAFSAGIEVAALIFSIVYDDSDLDNACVSEPLDALIDSGVYQPTCADGLELLAGGSDLCSQYLPSNTTCPEVCEQMMGLAFDLCTEADVLPGDGGFWGEYLGGFDEDINATQVVALALEQLGSSDCAEVLATKSFRASTTPAESTSEEAKTTSARLGPPTLPMESTSAEEQSVTGTGYGVSTSGDMKGTTASGVGSQSTTSAAPDEVASSSRPGSSLPAAATALAAALLWWGPATSEWALPIAPVVH